MMSDGDAIQLKTLFLRIKTLKHWDMRWK